MRLEEILSSQGAALIETAQAEGLHSKSALAQGAVFDRASRLSAVSNTSVFAQHLAVVSEAMLRLCWNKVEPLKRSGTPFRGQKRSEGGSLLRTDHMLGGSQSSTFIKQLSLVLEEITNENALNEP